MWLNKIIIIILAFVMVGPGIYVLWAWTRNNFSMRYLMQNLNYATDLDGFGGLPLAINYDPTNSVKDPSCTQGYFIGLEELPDGEGVALCEEICQSGDYDYRFISKSGIYINNKEIRGSWCLPKPITRCNLNTSNAYIGIHNYECITRFPELLGGTSGNQIIGCGQTNTFVDELDHTTYSKYIPSNLIINDLDERLPNGKYRYRCKLNANEMTLEKTKLGGRFDVEQNVCSFFNSPGTLDFKDLSCKCESNHHMNEDKSLPCSDCTSGYGIVDEDYKQEGARYGFSFGRNCVHPANISYGESSLGAIPCGLGLLLKKPVDAKSGCQRTLVLATNSYTPQSLERIYG